MTQRPPTQETLNHLLHYSSLTFTKHQRLHHHGQPHVIPYAWDPAFCEEQDTSNPYAKNAKQALIMADLRLAICPN